jgi:uncharacterized protein (DUF1697 family)
MTTYIALLRGINVGGKKPAAMADLRRLLAQLGLADPQSVLQSGNLVFRNARRSPAQLERLLETEAERHLGLQTNFLVRTAAEWKRLVGRNPFRAEAKRDPGHLLVMFLKDKPSVRAVRALQAAIQGREVVRALGAHAYVVYPDGIGRSRLTLALIEKHLATRATGRNWNTVLKLKALATAPR